MLSAKTNIMCRAPPNFYCCCCCCFDLLLLVLLLLLMLVLLLCCCSCCWWCYYQLLLITTTPVSKIHSLDAPAPFPLSGGIGVKDAGMQSEQKMLIVNHCYSCQPEQTFLRVSNSRALTSQCTVRLRGPTSKLACAAINMQT